MANLRLTDWYYEQGNYKEAKKCAEEILSVGGDDTFLETLQKINTELEREMKREYAQNHDPVWDWIWLVLSAGWQDRSGNPHGQGTGSKSSCGQV